VIQFYRCENVLVSDVTIVDPPMWTIHPVLSRDVTVRGVTVHSTLYNTDGCDPEACTDVHMSDCRFDTNDGCIAVKSGRDEDGIRVGVPSSNIVIERWGGVAIGSEMSGGVRNVFAYPRRSRRNGRLEHRFVRPFLLDRPVRVMDGT
jgi:polygalacturonase